LRVKVQELKGEKPIALKILNKDGIRELELTPTYRTHAGQKYLSIGIVSGVVFNTFMVESQAKSIGDAINKATQRTYQGIIGVLAGFKKLVTGSVSMDQLGGPIMIGKVASDSFNMGLSMFFRLMALISINLGIINLFPIPVLDGGHIVFLILEGINKGPLSKKKMMIAQQFGMSLLFLLIFVSLFNDISRLF